MYAHYVIYIYTHIIIHIRFVRGGRTTMGAKQQIPADHHHDTHNNIIISTIIIYYHIL